MNNSIAIIGIAFELPKIKSWDDLHRSLYDKTSFIGAMPQDRLQEIQKLTGNIEMSRAGYIDEIDKFDNEYFGFTERESVKTFPEHRLFLTHAMRAFYNAGYNETMLKGTKTGVFYTAAKSSYHWIGGFSDLSFGHIDMVSGIEGTRLAKYLDTRGPVMSISTSCSSSLVAVNVARQSLNDHECDMAIVGGVKILTVTRESAMGNVVHSKKEVCSPFDNEADGMMNGEGSVFFVLKRYEDAVRDQDTILAEIKGIGINHGGDRISSLTAPSAAAQTDAITAAWARAGVDARQIRYIEAHGTATILGDPIEIEGVKQAFRQMGDGREVTNCGISSFKGQIGHLDYLSGLAGLLRLVTAMNTKTIPVQPNFKSLNKYFQLDNTGLYVTDKAEAWPGNGGERIGGVSSFGMTGTNVHIVVSSKEQPPQQSGISNGRYYVQISHSTPAGLRNYATYIARKAAGLGSIEEIHTMCAKLNRVFRAGKLNRAISYTTREELIAALELEMDISKERIFLLLDEEVVNYPSTQIEGLFNENIFIKQSWDKHVGISVAELNNEGLASVLFQFSIYRYLQDKIGSGLKFVTPKGGSVLNALLKSEITVNDLRKQMEHTQPWHDVVDEVALKKYMYEQLAGKKLTIIDFSRKDKHRFDDLQMDLRVIAGTLPDTDRFLLYADILAAGVNPMQTGYNPVFHDLDLPYYNLKRFWPEIKAGFTEGQQPAAVKPQHAVGTETKPLTNPEEIRRIIRDSWASVLDTDDFDENDDFFELGGNSLLAMDMIDEIEKRITGVKISHEKIYSHTSIVKMAELLLTQLGAAPGKEDAGKKEPANLTGAEVAQIVRECWSLVLETNDFNGEDSFFEIGGTSLSALEMVDEVKKRIPNAPIAYEEIYTCATVAKMTDHMVSRMSNGAALLGTGGDNGHQVPSAIRESNYQKLLAQLKQEQFSRDVPDTILITGATGLLGMNMVDYLLANTRAQLFCLVRKTTAQTATEKFWSVFGQYFPDAGRHRITVVEGDLFQKDLGMPHLPELLLRAGMIFHIAGSPNFVSRDKAEDHINVVGTKNIVDWANKYAIKKLVFVSSISVVGETMPPTVENFYETDLNLNQDNGKLIHGASKLKAETYIRENYKFHSKIFRITNIGGRLGDGCFPADLSRNLMWLRLKSLAGFKYYSKESLSASSGVGLMPADVFAALIAEIAFGGSETLGVYHLAYRKYYTNGEVLNCLQRAGFEMEEIAHDDFVKYIASDKNIKQVYHQVAQKDHKFVLRTDATTEVISGLKLDKLLRFDREGYLDRLVAANLHSLESRPNVANSLDAAKK